LFTPHSGPRRAKRAKEIERTGQEFCQGIKGRGLGWLSSASG
jgi:hypothetical protein